MNELYKSQTIIEQKRLSSYEIENNKRSVLNKLRVFYCSIGSTRVIDQNIPPKMLWGLMNWDIVSLSKNIIIEKKIEI